MINVGGYHDKCGGYLEYRGGVQYRGGYHEYCGGYHEYRGGYDDIPPRYSNLKGWNPPTVLNILHSTHDIPPRAS